MTKKDGHIFINAACGDSQVRVIWRAARVALRENKGVRYRVVNKEEYRFLSLAKAKNVMTPDAWIQELRDYLSDPLSSREVQQLITPRTRERIIVELNKERAELHKECLTLDEEIKNIEKILSV